ncbi:MAG TPA: CPBP family intramembrane glutamic endopeptidase [Terracidiphilus sp.]|nr:CPBP family intramembrane glutamic endopeptidase [Terracidiphilus sp.]
MGFIAQHTATAGNGVAAAGQLASHRQAIPIYLAALVMDWALFYYCWAAVHHYGGSLWTLSGGRWNSWKDVLVDLGIMAPFLIVWEGTAYGVSRLIAGSVGPGSAKTVDSLLPQSLIEILIWIATSITAGICEEMVFRGFLQRQLHALSGNIAVAVLGQGLVFGLFHSYQGWRNVVVISVLGILYGALAVWRRNLRINIVAHAFTDVWEGWLKFIVWHIA